LHYIQQKSREEGIDGALKHSESDFDALLLCDRNGVGQQMAAQAGRSLHFPSETLLMHLGYPIICIPIGLDANGLPFSLSLQHSAWREDVLIKWASAIEDLVNEVLGWRAVPEYRNPLAKNIPVFES
jgi:amidase